MNKVYNIRKGLSINLKGKAEKIIKGEINSSTYSLKPTDYKSFVPKLVLKSGNPVKRGETVFYNKYNPEVCFVSPVSGTIKEVVRGDKRKILEVIIQSDGKDDSIKHDISNFSKLERKDIVELLLKAGIWPFLNQRPYGIIPHQDDVPRDIFISFYDSSPIAADIDYILKDKKEEINLALNLLSKLTDGNVYLNFHVDSDIEKLIDDKSNYKINYFKGKHPAGLVGVQINKISPINKGEIIWTVNASDLPIIGSFVKNGEFYPERIIALCGSEVKSPAYYKTRIGASVKEMLKETINVDNVRIISGNVLTGSNITDSPYLGFYSTSITVIPEGNHFEFMGWAAPGFNKYSHSKTFLSKLFPKKQFVVDTNMNGGHRAYVVTGQYESVCPIDIYPQLLIKAIMANDIDKMEQLGIYEVIEEDLALCEFVCTSKIQVQDILRNGINEMIKELS